jgi:uncharacterized membrane protein YeaQ/YmgE (transglycosylase-associated protein family)
MGILGFLLLGLIAGAIAKLILPGRSSGAMVGGFLGGLLFGEGVDEFFSLSSWALAIGGSLIVLVIYGAVTGRRK